MSDAATPLWRWLAVGGLCAYAGAHLLVTGEIAVDKARSMIITRAANPLAYWGMVSVLVVFAVLCLRKAWQKMRAP